MKKSLYIPLSIVAVLIIIITAAWPGICNVAKNFWAGFTESDKPISYNNKRALDAVEKGEFWTALKELNRAIKKDPDNAILYQNRGRISEKLGKYNDASDDYAKTTELDPTGKVGHLACYRLEKMADNLQQKEIDANSSESSPLYNTGIKYFDKAVDCYKANDFNAAREELQLAMTLCETAHLLNPANTELIGFLYMTKGFIYHIIGKQYAKMVKPNDSNYTAMVWLRRAYYPFSCSDNYYRHAKKYLTAAKQPEFVKGYISENDYLLKMAKKYIPTVDYEGRKYMKNIKIETAAIVDLDVLNMMISTGDYAGVNDFINKKLKDLKKADTTESQNAVGISYIYRAYSALSNALEHVDKDPEWIRQNKGAFKEQLNGCIEDLKTANAHIKNDSLKELTSNIDDIARQTWRQISDIAG